jgi:hypothetical protein
VHVLLFINLQLEGKLGAEHYFRNFPRNPVCPQRLSARIFTRRRANDVREVAETLVSPGQARRVENRYVV